VADRIVDRAIDKVVDASISDYVETVNEHDEVMVTANYAGSAIRQTLPIHGSCLIMIDRTNGNLVTIPVPNLDPNLEFVKFVRKVVDRM